MEVWKGVIWDSELGFYDGKSCYSIAWGHGQAHEHGGHEGMAYFALFRSLVHGFFGLGNISHQADYSLRGRFFWGGEGGRSIPSMASSQSGITVK